MRNYITGHRTEIHGETLWIEHVKNKHSLCKYYNKPLLYLFKPIVHIISYISFHGILSLDYPYIIATSGYINWRRRRNTNSVNSFTKRKKKRKKKDCAVGTVFSHINTFTCIWKKQKGALEIGKVSIFCTVSFLNISQYWQFFFHNESVEGGHLLFGTKFYVYVDMIFVHLKKKKMASEQIAALRKTLTESLIA